MVLGARSGSSVLVATALAITLTIPFLLTACSKEHHEARRLAVTAASTVAAQDTTAAPLLHPHVSWRGEDPLSGEEH